MGSEMCIRDSGDRDVIGGDAFPMTRPNGMIPMAMALVTTTRLETTMVTFALTNTPLLLLKEHVDAQILIVMALSTRWMLFLKISISGTTLMVTDMVIIKN